MDRMAATATTAAVGVTLLVLAALVYAAACVVAPFRTCRSCAGTRERKSWLGRIAPCWRCRGKGRRLRLGRRAFNHLHRLHHQGTRTRTR